MILAQKIDSCMFRNWITRGLNHGLWVRTINKLYTRYKVWLCYWPHNSAGNGKLLIRINPDFINACLFQNDNLTLLLICRFLIILIFVKTLLYSISSLVINLPPEPGSTNPQWFLVGKGLDVNRLRIPPMLLHSLQTYGVSGMLSGRLQPRCMLLHHQPRVSRARLSRWKSTPPRSPPGGWAALKQGGERGGNVTF